jgi:uncharacterized protein YutE (UPF0331/DUF86 family)
MVNKNLVAAKLDELVDRARRARQHCPVTVQELADDRGALDLVAFNLMLAVQVCADIASHIIADEGWAATKTLAGGFDRLVEHGVTLAATGEQLKRAVGLRNVIAHGYTRINVAMVHDAAMRGTLDIDAFATDVAKYVEAAPD